MQQQSSSANMTADRHLLSDKELHYLKDYMSWELLAMKKCAHAVQSTQDVDIQNQIKQIGQTHVQNYNSLLNFLQ